MRGFNTKKAQSCKDGGLIRGPGTGTSDSIPRGFKPGTFIMPADSTKAIGPDVLENIAKVPTKVSNGEFAHTPQEVHAVGINALRMMKDATHSPKDAGVYFANGGAVQGRGAKGFAIGGEVTNDVTRIGNSYSGGNIGGDITVNGATPRGFTSNLPGVPGAPNAAVQALPGAMPSPGAPTSLSTVPAAPVNSLTDRNNAVSASSIANTGLAPAVTSAPSIPGATPVPPGITPAAPKPPVDSFTARNNAVSSKSITNNGGRFDRNGQQFADGGDVRGFKPEPQRLAGGDKVLTEEEKKQRAQISPRNIYPQGSPSAGADIYANVGRGPSAPSVLETDPQAQADRSALSKMASGIGGANQNAGRAILDVASMVPRGLAGAYDSAVVRPMRAAGINAGYLSPHLVPDGVDPASMTPFTDQKRLQERNAAGAGRGFVNPSLSSKAVAPVTNLTVPETLTDAQRGGGNVAAVEAQATQPSAQPAPAQPAAQALAQVPSLAPVQAQGFQAPTVRHSGNDWQARNDLRSARVSASSIMNRPEWQGSGMGRFRGGQQQGPSESTMAYQAALAQDAAARGQEIAGQQQAMVQGQSNAREAMQQTGENQRTSLREQGFATRDQRKAGIDERTLAMQETESGFKTRAQAQLESLRGTLLDPNATTEQKAQAQQALLALSGKERGPRWKTSVVPGGVDAMGNKLPGYGLLTDEASGESKIIQPGQAAQLPTVNGPDDLAKLPKGAQFIGPDGKTRTKN